MLAVSCKKLNNINYPGLTKIGILTYPLYLIHENIGFIIFNNLESYINKYVLVILTTILMIVLSYILSQFYEPRMSHYLKFKLGILSKKFLKK
jgi:peptidoglycan/LPS O-acetylase OafA/YrhL